MRWLWVPLVWVGFALAALLTDAALFLVGAKGASNYAEDFCVEGGRGPLTELGYRPPTVAGPGRLRCDYLVHGRHVSAVYTDWWPFLFAAVGFSMLLGVLVVAAFCARTATRRAPTAAAA